MDRGGARGARPRSARRGEGAERVGQSGSLRSRRGHVLPTREDERRPAAGRGGRGAELRRRQRAAAGGRPPGPHGTARPSRPRSRRGCGRRTAADTGPGHGRRELRIEEVRFTTGARLVAFAGVEDRTAAEKLRGCVLEVPASSLPELEEDEYYPFELRGLRVFDEEGVEVGTVLELLDTPAQPVLSLRRAAGGEVLVPFTLEAVPTVDVPGGRLVVLRRFILE